MAPFPDPESDGPVAAAPMPVAPDPPKALPTQRLLNINTLVSSEVPAA